MFEELIELYSCRKDEIKKRLEDFRNVPPEDYFYEMAYCILTPQTSALNAEKAVNQLKRNHFHLIDIDPLPFLYSESYYIRFHHTKAKRLENLKGILPEVNEVILNRTITAFKKRELLVSLVNGFGLKETTHFLRNIGKNDGLAILDRHILRNLKKFNAIDHIPSSMSTKKYYLLEEQFRRFADRIEIPLDELDLLFWSMETGIILK